ncbi:MAG: GntR family transcriptional regulator [Candidatus Eisenbacteria bacterium]
MRYLVVDTRSQVPLYEQILDQIRSRVRTGELVPRTPLPSVRQLAADLAVNPNTVAKAYMLLEREGIIQTVARRGVFVAGAAPARAHDWEDRRFAESLEKVLEDAKRLGLDRRQLLAAVNRRLRSKTSKRKPTGGRSR